jgi:hypothetical protein
VKLENCLNTNPDLKDTKISPLADHVEKKILGKVHLTKHELEGLSDIVAFLQNLAPTKRFVPKDIPDPDLLLEETKVDFSIFESGCFNMDFCLVFNILEIVLDHLSNLSLQPALDFYCGPVARGYQIFNGLLKTQ